MTDDQANRVIAIDLGWKPHPFIERMWIKPDGIIDGSLPNYFTDPAMRDLLLLKLVEAGWEIHIAQFPMAENCTMKMLQRADGTERYLDEPYTRIWPLAYIRAHNLTADQR